MPNRKEYLKQLLHKEEWTAPEQEWMMEYLDTNDFSELEMVAAEYFNADLLTAKHILDKRLSDRMLNDIHQRIGVGDSSFKGVFRLFRQKIAIAAAILLLAGATWYVLAATPRKRTDVCHYIRKTNSEIAGWFCRSS